MTAAPVRVLTMWTGVLLLAGACEFSGESGSRTDGPEAGSDASRSTTLALTDVSRFEGLFTVDEGWRFVPCGEDPVPVEGPAIPELLEVYEELVPQGAEGMFVDLLGQVRERNGRGWLEAMEIRRAHFEGFGCDERDPEVRLAASGTEPFWSLEVFEGTAVWRTPSGAREFRHDGLGRTESGSWALSGRPVSALDGAAPVLFLEAWPEPCRNPMSGAFNHLRVEVSLEGDVSTGCAYLGAEYEAGLEDAG